MAQRLGKQRQVHLSVSLAYLVDCREMKDSKTKMDSLWGMTGKLALWPPHACLCTHMHTSTYPHIQKTNKQTNLFSLPCSLYFNPSLCTPEEGLYSTVLSFSALACVGVSWERKRWVCLGSTCSIPCPPCPDSIWDLNSSGSRPSLSPSTITGSGSRGDLDIQTAAQRRARISRPCQQVSIQALPGRQDAEKCLLVPWWEYRNACKNAFLGCFVGRVFIIRHPSGVHRAGCECPCATWEFPSIEAMLPLFVVPQRTSRDITRDSYLTLSCCCLVVLPSWKKNYPGKQKKKIYAFQLYVCTCNMPVSVYACLFECVCMHMWLCVCAHGSIEKK